MRCPSCGHSFKTLEDEAGDDHPCPACGHEEWIEVTDEDHDWETCEVCCRQAHSDGILGSPEPLKTSA